MVVEGLGRGAVRWLSWCALALAAGACGEDNLIDWPQDGPGGGPLQERLEPWPIPRLPDVERPGTVEADGPAPGPLAVVAQGGAACPGAPVRLVARTLGAVPPVEITWSPPDGLDDPHALQPVATGETTTRYTVAVRDATGATAERTVVVERYAPPLPRIDFASGGPVLCAGATLELDASGSVAGEGAAYAWDLDGDGVVDRTGPRTGVLAPAASGTATLTVTDANGCTASATQPWEVRPIPVVVAGTDGGLCAGGSVRLGGPAQPGLTYRWSPADGLDDPHASDPVATPTADTVYTVTASDAFGCSASDAVQLAVHPLPVADAGPDRTVARGGSIRLLGGASGGTPGYAFAWSPAGSLDDATRAQPLASPAADQRYTLTVTDANGCVDVDEALVEVGQGIHVDAGQDERLCLDGGAGVTLSAQAAGGVGTPLAVTFSEPIDPASAGGVRLIDLATGYPVAAEALYDDQTRTVTLDPRRMLEPQRQYRLDVSGVRDQAGNAMAGRWSAPFTTAPVIFLERFEGSAASWLLQQPWDIDAQAARAGASGLSDSPGGDYAAGASRTVTSPPLDVQGRASVQLSFWNRRLLAADQDRLHVEYSADCATWTTARSLAGPSGWLPVSATLPTGGAPQLWFRLRLHSDASVQMDGVFVDELVVR